MNRWLLLFLLPTAALAKTKSFPQLYNRGVLAYQSNDFARAAALFQNANSSPDRALQQRSLYNFGNTCYRLGEAQPPQAQQLWQRAIKSYEAALALDPNDADAKFNRDLVKKKLEELKKQQEQKQQQNQKDHQDKKQDQQKEKNDQQQSQGQKNQQKQQQQSEQQKEQQNKQEQEKQQAQQEEEHKQKDRQQQQQPEQAQADKLDKQQAKALLDDLRENEQNWNFFPEVQMKDLKDTGEPAKDW